MTRPNIVLVIADDMGYGDLGRNNPQLPVSPTPNLDRLLDEGLCLPQAYSGSPVCAPARAALMTGRYPHRTGAINLSPLHALNRLSLREMTLADMLKKAGYVTGHVGKWHLGEGDPRYYPCNRGFRESIGFYSGGSDYYRWTLYRNGSQVNSDGSYLTDVLTNEAVNFVQRHQREPFFLYLAYNAPHRPLQVPAEEELPFAETGKFAAAVNKIYGMIRRMDKGVGRVLQTLDDLNLTENTIFIFTSDNGPDMQGAGEQSTFRSNCCLQGSKYYVYEGGIRVPFIVRWPKELAAGTQCSQVMHFVDVLPTLLEAVGVRCKAATLDGSSVLSQWRAEASQELITRYWQWNRYLPNGLFNAAIRKGDWKLVRPATLLCKEMAKEDIALLRQHWAGKVAEITPPPIVDLGQPLPVELYNLREDAMEQRNLASTQGDLVKELLSELDNWFAAVEGERQTLPDYRW